MQTSEVTLSDGRVIVIRAPSLLDLGEYIQFNAAQAEVKAVYDALEAIRIGVIVPVPSVDLGRALPLISKVTGLGLEELGSLPIMDGLALLNEVTRLSRPKAPAAIPPATASG